MGARERQGLPARLEAVRQRFERPPSPAVRRCETRLLEAVRPLGYAATERLPATADRPQAQASERSSGKDSGGRLCESISRGQDVIHISYSS